MTTQGIHLVATSLTITLSMAGGYAYRKTHPVRADRIAQTLMTLVAVLGYPIINLLSIWPVQLRSGDFWLPVMGAVQMVLLAALAIPIARKLTSDRGEIGVFTICTVIGNSGLTMGGFVVYLLLGTVGLGLGNVYCLMFGPMVILVGYPIARHYAGSGPAMPLWKLLLRSIFDWRSIGLPMAVAAILLSPSVFNVQRPQQVKDWHVIDILMYGINCSAYFAIGLRLRLSRFAAIKKLIIALAATRFGLGLATGVALWAITLLTPWPLHDKAKVVFIIESFPSTAVTCVAIANMFDCKPDEASALFVANTLMYLAIVLPILVLVCG